MTTTKTTKPADLDTPAERDRIAASVADVFARIGTPDWADDRDEFETWDPSYGTDYDGADDQR